MNAGGKRRDQTYGPSDVDFFFIIANGDGKYLIPLDVVTGVKSIVLDRKYAAFKLDD